MLNFIVVFLGGGIGSFSRFWLQGLLYRFLQTDFPYGTAVVNVIGAFLIGLMMTAFEERFLLDPSLRIFLTIGILGGFTTFSSFSYETVMMLRDSEFLYAGLNICVNVLLCMGATYAGMFSGKLI